jgi:hypothetical protein
MTWLAEHGFVSCWADYLALPVGILDDCRMVMTAEARGRKIRESKRG